MHRLTRGAHSACAIQQSASSGDSYSQPHSSWNGDCPRAIRSPPLGLEGPTSFHLPDYASAPPSWFWRKVGSFRKAPYHSLAQHGGVWFRGPPRWAPLHPAASIGGELPEGGAVEKDWALERASGAGLCHRRIKHKCLTYKRKKEGAGPLASGHGVV